MNVGNKLNGRVPVGKFKAQEYDNREWQKLVGLERLHWAESELIQFLVGFLSENRRFWTPILRLRGQRTVPLPPTSTYRKTA